MKNKLTTSAAGARAVYDAGGEIYHLECMRLEKGDDAVIAESANHFKQKDKLKPADAHIRAGQFMNDVDALKAGEFGFKAVREKLASSSNRAQAHPDDDFGFVPA
jgi:hypothetical protein